MAKQKFPAFLGALIVLCSTYYILQQKNRTKVSPIRVSRAEEPRPPLSSLIGDNETNITGDVEFLLDFVIAGHPKCATSAMMRWLAAYDEIQMYTHEMHSIGKGKPAKFVEEMYNLPQGKHFKRGYKAPNEIRHPHSLYLLAKYWPNAKLVVGLRHPVLWFQSWFNFKTRQGRDPMKMVHRMMPPMVRYHNNLALLGKTNVSDPAEASLLGRYHPSLQKSQKKLLESMGIDTTATMYPLPQKVFLYVDLQLSDSNASRYDLFLEDLRGFLGLSKPLVGPLAHEKRVVNDGNVTQINVCDAHFPRIRSDLIQVGTAASQWIRTYFLPHPDVTVSAPEHFEELLESWTRDPCLEM